MYSLCKTKEFCKYYRDIFRHSKLQAPVPTVQEFIYKKVIQWWLIELAKKRQDKHWSYAQLIEVHC